MKLIVKTQNNQSYFVNLRLNLFVFYYIRTTITVIDSMVSNSEHKLTGVLQAI